MIIGNMARDSLVTFSVNKLREIKLVTSNFKNGFSFHDNYYMAGELKRLYRFMIAYISREIPFLHLTQAGYEDGQSYMKVVSQGSKPYLKLSLMYDDSIYRYIQRINGPFAALDLPFRIEIQSYKPTDNMSVFFYTDINNQPKALQTYKLLLLLPEIVTVLKTLSRKARYTNEQFRTCSRSTCSGFETPTAA